MSLYKLYYKKQKIYLDNFNCCSYKLEKVCVSIADFNS